MEPHLEQLCDFMYQPPLERFQRRCVFRLSMLAWSCTKTSLASYLRNHLRQLHQIHNIAGGGDKDELIKFSGQKVKSQVHSKIMQALQEAFSHPFLEYILMKLLTVPLNF